MARPDKKERIARFAQAARDRHLFYDGTRLPYNPMLTPFAQALRENPTPCEIEVHKFLKSLGIKIRAQHPIDIYIVDFYIPKAHLVIEIDGEQHVAIEGKEYDANRDEVLRMYSLEVMRISNTDVRTKFNEVCSRIRKKVNDCFSEQ